MKRVQQGFTLIEIMVSVAIVGILMAVAIPAYSDYVIRGRLSEAFTALGGAQPAAEQYWSNNRKYDGFDGTSAFPAATANFRYTYTATASSYTLTATGIGKMNGFVYTIDQNGTHATTGSPTGWGVSTSCWVDHKGGACSN
ncbi:prepilin-type N-terminal cleavage/methylation domain-containing protein [Rugamonas sp. FT107W]|uniref:Prepilin-type N-terminal cleavage/methylation domain-containing protein n=1 Tax=Duganella vulcania TaxID=2692166 RepID=A0A845HNE6_9BURK|nr:type IV pilin protein [Duganella vulcania]MYN18979.1 prepilin-type N-terminal cleavage/methylation domain-containing protein [Duganella vulcania]